MLSVLLNLLLNLLLLYACSSVAVAFSSPLACLVRVLLLACFRFNLAPLRSCCGCSLLRGGLRARVQATAVTWLARWRLPWQAVRSRRLPSLLPLVPRLLRRLLVLALALLLAVEPVAEAGRAVRAAAAAAAPGVSRRCNNEIPPPRAWV